MYYDRMGQEMGEELESAKAKLIEFASPENGRSEVLFDHSGNPVCGFNWVKTGNNKISMSPWYNL